jgi:hypothetical protein
MDGAQPLMKFADRFEVAQTLVCDFPVRSQTEVYAENL